MKFSQIDRIVDLQPGKSITATRALSLSEGYLADHFPRFPVFPGVLMLEGCYQAGMFLAMATDRFRHSSTRLKAAHQVKFRDFLEPGNQLRLEVTWKNHQDSLIQMQAAGKIEGQTAIKARLVVELFNLADRGLAPTAHDELARSARQNELLQLLDPRGNLKKQLAHHMTCQESDP